MELNFECVTKDMCKAARCQASYRGFLPHPLQHPSLALRIGLIFLTRVQDSGVKKMHPS